MAQQPEHRRALRFPVPPALGDRGGVLQRIRLLDLSAEGAQIEHISPLPDRHLYYFNLPGALRGGRLQGAVIWSVTAGRREVAAGKSVACYRSGLLFQMLTPQQQRRLAAALGILKATQEG